MMGAVPQRNKDPASMGKAGGSAQNKIHEGDRAAHDWYRFVLSFPPHLVRQYIEEFGLDKEDTVLDPFCGTGTTIVECCKLGIPSVGIEANTMGFFATSVKVDWGCLPDRFRAHAEAVARVTTDRLLSQGIHDSPFFDLNTQVSPEELWKLPEEAGKLLLRDSISPFPLHKTLILLDTIEKQRVKRYVRHEKLALAKALVGPIGNLRFGPEVGVGKKKTDAPVVAPWLAACQKMANDLGELRRLPAAPADVHLGDSRDILRFVRPRTVDAVITSPPYPNEKDYTRTTRLESVILGFLHTKSDLRELKGALIRSNTRNVYKNDEDDIWVADNADIQEIAEKIEARRAELGKSSGFERLYHRVTKLYFGGMKRHLSELREVLRPGARLAYVVGDQASYLRVMIRTGALLADIAESLGYEVIRTDLFRTRLATATKKQLREEVVLLHWPGHKGK